MEISRSEYDALKRRASIESKQDSRKSHKLSGKSTAPNSVEHIAQLRAMFGNCRQGRFVSFTYDNGKGFGQFDALVGDSIRLIVKNSPRVFRNFNLAYIRQVKVAD